MNDPFYSLLILISVRESQLDNLVRQVCADVARGYQASLPQDHSHPKHQPHPGLVQASGGPARAQEHSVRLDQGAVRDVLRLRLYLGLRVCPLLRWHG